MQIENKFCRQPLAASINKMPGMMWIPNPNVVYTKGAKFGEGSKYESGRPDGFVFRMFNTPVCIECKGMLRRLYMGNPESKDDTKGWSRAQRNWYEKVAKATGTPYFIAVFLADTIETTADGTLYLVPASHYLRTEQLLLSTTGSRYLPYRHDSTKAIHISAENEWSSFALPKIAREYVVNPQAFQ